MTRSTLPNETLIEIFSHLPSSKATLYNLSLSSSTFSELAKPFLYHYVTITNKDQRERLKNVKEEDAKLVRKLTIRGVEVAPNELEDDGSECSVGTNCIVDLFTGNLLDISVIEILHVAHLYENAEEQMCRVPSSIYVAVNLTELSILDHHGGGAYWRTVLRRAPVFPKLLRLGISKVTLYGHFSFGLSGSTEEESEDDEPVVIQTEMGVTNAELVDQLEILVTHPETGLRGKRPLNYGHLLPLRPPTAESIQAEYLLLALKESLSVICLDDQINEPPSDDIFDRMLEAYRQSTPRNPIFLSLPYLESDLSGDVHDTLSEIAEEGAEIHLGDERDEEDSSSLIPSSFVDFVRRQKKKEEDEEGRKKMAS